MNKVKNLSKSSSGTGSVERLSYQGEDASIGTCSKQISGIQFELSATGDLQRKILRQIVALGDKLRPVRLRSALDENLQAEYDKRTSIKGSSPETPRSRLAVNLSDVNTIWMIISELLEALYTDLDLTNEDIE